MAPRRKNQRRKKQTRTQIYGKAAVQLYKDVKMLKDVINVEHRYYDSTFYSAANTDSACDSYLDTITEGNDYNNRSGNQVKVQRISGRGLVVKDAVYDAQSHNVRFIIFIDKPAEFGTDANTWRKIMSTGSAGYEVLACKEPDVIRKTKILYDKTFVMNGHDATNAATFRKFSFNIPINRITRWDETEAITANDIKYMVISSASTGTSAISVRQHVKVSWTDN